MSESAKALQASLHRCGVNRLFACSVLVLREQTWCIAAIKLVWTAVILNGNEVSGPITSGRALKMYSWALYKIFRDQKGGFERTSSNTPPPCLWACMSSNCELSSHHARILHGGRLHGGPPKPQNCQNWGVGPCSGMGACTGQYGKIRKLMSKKKRGHSKQWVITSVEMAYQAQQVNCTVPNVLCAWINVKSWITSISTTRTSQ